jgi:hypothetical protein
MHVVLSHYASSRNVKKHPRFHCASCHANLSLRVLFLLNIMLQCDGASFVDFKRIKCISSLN